jgi:hypothetical protein
LEVIAAAPPSQIATAVALTIGAAGISYSWYGRY